MQKLNINIAESGNVPNRRRLDPNARRAQLLEHAIAAFAEAGIERAVHADVAVRAKVSTPTVFKYFPTRGALVDAVLSEIEDAFVDFGGMKSSGASLELKELTLKVTDTISDLCVERPNLMKVALAWSVAFSPVRARYKAFENSRLRGIQNFLKTDEPDPSDARILLSGLFLFVRMHFDDTSKETRERYVDRLSDMFDAAPESTRKLRVGHQ